MHLSVDAVSAELAVLVPQDRLDAFTAPDFRALGQQCLEAGVTSFVVDLSVTPFLDSAGMAAIVSLLKRSRQAGGTVALVWPRHAPVKRILMLTRFDRVFAGYDDRQAAVAALMTAVAQANVA
jgi:anti-sigma B factor antagonist